MSDRRGVYPLVMREGVAASERAKTAGTAAGTRATARATASAKAAAYTGAAAAAAVGPHEAVVVGQVGGRGCR